jgi:chloramphenicol-sensitive protein RarD
MSPPKSTTGPEADTGPGFFLALAAYLIWGVMPLYMKALAHVPTLEVLAHRVIWSVPVALVILLVLRRTQDLSAALRQPRTLVMAGLTATLVSVNWGVYVWAIQTDQALEAALGYYINPLFSIALGALLLGERLSRLQWTAVALAALAVGVITLEAGRLPLVALALTLSWGLYAYFKRALPVGPNQGFTLEVVLLTPFALAYLGWMGAKGDLHSLNASTLDLVLLLGCGVVTAVPLMLYANGAKGLRLSTIAIMQYLTPTLVMLTAVFVFAEPVALGKIIAFPLIWVALILYTAEVLRLRR